MRINLNKAICKQCNTEFSYKWRNDRNRTYCTKSCRYKFEESNRTIKNCTVCNKEIKLPKCYSHWDNCSTECNQKARKIDPNLFTNEQKIERMKMIFERHIIRKGEDECWDWNGAKREGYGVIAIFRRAQKASRISWIIHVGDIPKGMFVCHHCDNPICNNPKHLFLGTPKDNVTDMINKGRAKFGINIKERKRNSLGRFT